jgi:hypothetical protein
LEGVEEASKVGRLMRDLGGEGAERMVELVYGARKVIVKLLKIRD